MSQYVVRNWSKITNFPSSLVPCGALVALDAVGFRCETLDTVECGLLGVNYAILILDTIVT